MMPYRFILCLVVALLLSATAFWGCSQFGDSIKATTGVVHTGAHVASFFPGKTVLLGDASYAEVNPAFAPKWHSYTASVMDMLGMATNWSAQFDCNRFANVKLAVIHVRFLVDTWHARAPGQGPAVAEYWYTPNAVYGGAAANQGRPTHAILVTIEGGRRVFRDIYTSNALTLTAFETESAFLVKF
jgi:hypothetical protein